jgi:hypothetical protein
VGAWGGAGGTRKTTPTYPPCARSRARQAPCPSSQGLRGRRGARPALPTALLARPPPLATQLGKAGGIPILTACIYIKNPQTYENAVRCSPPLPRPPLSPLPHSLLSFLCPLFPSSPRPLSILPPPLPPCPPVPPSPCDPAYPPVPLSPCPALAPLPPCDQDIALPPCPPVPPSPLSPRPPLPPLPISLSLSSPSLSSPSPSSPNLPPPHQCDFAKNRDRDEMAVLALRNRDGSGGCTCVRRDGKPSVRPSKIWRASPIPSARPRRSAPDQARENRAVSETVVSEYSGTAARKEARSVQLGVATAMCSTLDSDKAPLCNSTRKSSHSEGPLEAGCTRNLEKNRLLHEPWFH